MALPLFFPTTTTTKEILCCLSRLRPTPIFFFVSVLQKKRDGMGRGRSRCYGRVSAIEFFILKKKTIVFLQSSLWRSHSGNHFSFHFYGVPGVFQFLFKVFFFLFFSRHILFSPLLSFPSHSFVFFLALRRRKKKKTNCIWCVYCLA